MKLINQQNTEPPNRIKVVILVWSLLVFCGFGILVSYENRPGNSLKSPSILPPELNLTLSKDKPTLILVAHPFCNCTAASLYEYEQILSRTQSQVVSKIIFSIPPGMPQSDWRAAENIVAARNIAGSEVIIDTKGVAARRLGALTSGHVLLFDREQKLRFSGGITPGRSHRGDSRGKLQILKFLRENNLGDTSSPIFGCALDES